MLSKNQPWNVLRFKGTNSWNSITHKATTAVNNSKWRKGVPTVRFQTAANHNMTVGSAITLTGTTNYDGTHKILTGSATDKIYIASRYVAEELTTTDLFRIMLKPGVPFLYGGFKLHLAGVVNATENLTVTLDAGAGSVHDTVIYTKTMNAVTNIVLNYLDEPIPFSHKDDALIFAWANGDPEIWGLEVFWRAI